MPQHPLDRQMRLAGVGRPEHGGNACAGRAIVRERGRRESHVLQVFLLTGGARTVIASDGLLPPSLCELRRTGRRYAPRNDGKPFWFLGVNSAETVSFCDGDAVAA
jgi:hypothetical protein